MQKKPEKAIESAYLAVMTNFEKCLHVQGTTPNTWRVIETLHENSGLTLKELSKRTDIKIPALSKLIDRMVRDALVHRIQSSTDRRSIQLFISDHGRETFHKCLPEVRAFRSHLAEVLDSHTHLALTKLERMDQKTTAVSISSPEEMH